MLWLRKCVFYIFAVIYLILCPLIVSRMLGFIFNPLTHRLVKTGLIYISTNPPDATVYIDGRQAHQTTPTSLRDLTPGQHFIRIELSGYKDWERSVPILGKKATVLANTLLIPQEWPLKIISPRSYENIINADDDILIAANPILKNIDLFHTTQGIAENFREENAYNKTSLFSQNSVYANGSLIHLYSTPKSPFILIETLIKEKHKFLWINLKENPPMVEDISDLFPEIPRRIIWDNSNFENIYAFYNSLSDDDTNKKQIIYRINIKDKAIYPEDANKLPAKLIQHAPALPLNKFLINDKNDLITKEGQWIRIYPKEEFDRPHVYDIAQSKPSTNMYFEERNGELFFLDNALQWLCAAQILPYKTILTLPIPDALRFNISKEESKL